MAVKVISVLLLLVLTHLCHAENFKRYIWFGNVKNSSFNLRIDIEPGEQQLYVTTNETLDTAKAAFSDKNAHESKISHSTEIYGNLRHYNCKGLNASTKYFVHVLDPKKKKPDLAGSVTTFPTENTTTDIVVALGSCQVRSRDAQALNELSYWNEVIKKENPAATFFMLHMGDLHYSNIRSNSTVLFERATRNVVTDYLARRLFSTVPVAYMPDDHDFGGNNAGARSKSKEAAQANYRVMIPSAELRSSTEMYNAFTVGKVRFILTDLRSSATRAEGNNPAFLLGVEQRSFLEDELKRASSYDAVVWMSTRPWIAKKKEGSDTWGGFSEQRRQIADYIVEQKVTNLVMVSGDAHMIAADDGRHSLYAASNGSTKGFPVFHAAPLANFGSSKGGPYSEGCRAYRWVKNYQYALLRISKPVGKNVSITFEGYTVQGTRNLDKLAATKPILSLTVESPFGAENAVKGGGQGSCSIKLAPTWYFVAFAVGIVLFALLIFYCVVKRKAQRKAKMMELNPNAYDEHMIPPKNTHGDQFPSESMPMGQVPSGSTPQDQQQQQRPPFALQ